MQEQVSRIEVKADELLHEIEAENAELSANRPGLAASFGGQTRCVRAIAKVVIHDMVTRLS
jgi:serine/threonine-protein kinase HipA